MCNESRRCVPRVLVVLILSALQRHNAFAYSLEQVCPKDEVSSKVDDTYQVHAEEVSLAAPDPSSEFAALWTMPVVWIIGGPGCGKGTQCERMISKYGFRHISSGDILREEISSGGPKAASLQEYVAKGLLVPTDTVLELIKERITSGLAEGGTTTGFLIDGYPRELEQGILFEKIVCPVDLIIFFDVSNETLKERLLGRAAVSQRSDDNEETIKKRIEIFNKNNGDIINHFQNKVLRINAEGTVDDIFGEVSKALDKLLA